MPKNKKSRKNSKAQHPFHSAPKQGMGSTEDWCLNDIGIVVLRLAAGSPTAYQVRFAADVNGFSWTQTEFGQSTALTSLPAPADVDNQVYYGQTNTQFTQLAQLWDEYRVDSVNVELQPFGSGGGYSASGIVHLIDEGDFMGGKNATFNNSEAFYDFAATQRNVQLHGPYQTLKKSLSFQKYLGQGQDKAWLQTIESAGTREFYATRWTNPATPDARTPALAFIFNIGAINTTAAQFCVMTYRIRTKMTFRQRRPFTGDVVPRPLKSAMICEEEPVVEDLTKSKILRALNLE